MYEDTLMIGSGALDIATLLQIGVTANTGARCVPSPSSFKVLLKLVRRSLFSVLRLTRVTRRSPALLWLQTQHTRHYSLSNFGGSGIFPERFSLLRSVTRISCYDRKEEEQTETKLLKVVKVKVNKAKLLIKYLMSGKVTIKQNDLSRKLFNESMEVGMCAKAGGAAICGRMRCAMCR